MTQVYGDLKAKVVIVLPGPGSIGVEANQPIAGTPQRILRFYMSHIGYPIEKCLLVNMYACHLPKPKKSVVDNCAQFLDPIVRNDQVKIIIGVGKDVAKYLFSRGGKSVSIEHLVGKPLNRFDYPGKTIFFVRDPREYPVIETDDGQLEWKRLNKQEYQMLAKYLKELD